MNAPPQCGTDNHLGTSNSRPTCRKRDQLHCFLRSVSTGYNSLLHPIKWRQRCLKHNDRCPCGAEFLLEHMRSRRRCPRACRRGLPSTHTRVLLSRCSNLVSNSTCRWRSVDPVKPVFYDGCFNVAETTEERMDCSRELTTAAYQEERSHSKASILPQCTSVPIIQSTNRTYHAKIPETPTLGVISPHTSAQRRHPLQRGFISCSGTNRARRERRSQTSEQLRQFWNAAAAPPTYWNAAPVVRTALLRCLLLLALTSMAASSSSAGPTPLPTPSPTPSPVPTPSPTPSPLPTPSPTPSPMPTPSPTPSPLPSPSPTPLPDSSPEASPHPIPASDPIPIPDPILTPAPILSAASALSPDCHWGEGAKSRRFVRVREDAPLEYAILSVNVTHPQDLHMTQTQTPTPLFRLSHPPLLGRVVVAGPLSELLQEGRPAPVIKLLLTCGENTFTQQVTVYVEDVNDHAPVFAHPVSTVSVDELTPVGLVVVDSIKATDADKPNTANSEVYLEIMGGDPEGYFELTDRKKGVLQLARTLDYDEGPRHFDLEIVAKDMGSPSLSSTALLRVMVQDADDKPPVFGDSLYRIHIREDPGQDPGNTIYRPLTSHPPVTAKDGDEGINATLRYAIVPGPHSMCFSMDPVTGGVAQVLHIDRERLETNYITLHITAHQVSAPQQEASSRIEVLVEDVNDNMPRFEHDLYAISIVENLPTGFSVVQVAAKDADKGINAQFRYEVRGEPAALAVHPDTGWLTVADHNMLDREDRSTISLQVCARQAVPMERNPRTAGPGALEDSSTSLSLASSKSETVKESLNRKRQPDPVEERVLISVVEEPKLIAIKNYVTSTTEAFPLKNSVIETSTRATPHFKPSPTDKTASSPISRIETSQVKGTEKHQLRHGSSRSRSTQAAGDPVPNTSIPSTQTMFTLEDAMPVLETLPFGTRTAPRKYSRSLKDDDNNLDVSKAVAFTRAITKVIPPPEIQPLTSSVIEFKVKNYTSEFVRKKRGAEATRKFNTLRRAKPKSLVPIKILENKEESVSQSENVGSIPENVSCAAIQLTLLDANDNNPVFLPSNQYHFSVRQDAEPGMTIGKVEAADADDSINGQVTYRLQDRTNPPAPRGKDNASLTNAYNNAITIDENTGYLYLNRKVNVGEFTTFVEASDTPTSVSERRTSLAIVVISVTAGDTWQPRFQGAPFEFWVGSDAEIGTSVGQVRVTDFDPRHLFFDMFHNYKEGVPFAIEESSGIVSVVSALPQYGLPQYLFEAVATDGRKSLVTNLTVHIAPPVFTRTSGRGADMVVYMSVQENLAGGLVGDIREELSRLGVDLPLEPHLELVSPESRPLFVIAQDGSLYTVTALDHETHSEHTLVVLSARTTLLFYVKVKVDDVNDNPPQLNAVSYEGSISEDALSGASVTMTPKIKVMDADKYPGSSWSLHLRGPSSGMFHIGATSGQVSFIGGDGSSLDREVTPTYHMLIVAVDDGNLTTSANLTIRLEDVNDNYPLFSTHKPPLLASSRELTEPSAPRWMQNIPNHMYFQDAESEVIRVPENLAIGSRVTQLSAQDKDVGLFADIRYLIEYQTSYDFADNGSTVPLIKPSNAFSIEPKSGTMFVGSQLLANHFYLLNVSAVDGGGLSSTTFVSVAVYDINDHAPTFKLPIYNFEILEGSYLVGEVGVVKADDADFGKNAKISYQIVINDTSKKEDFPFRIGETSGMILATGQVDRELRSRFQFMVVAADHGEPPLSSSVAVIITVSDSNDHDPKFYGYQSIYSASGNSGNKSLPVYLKTVPENIAKGSFVTTVFANDSDSVNSGNGIVLYKIQETDSPFGIDSKNGSIYTHKDMDYESKPTVRATIVALDVGSPPRSASALLQVTLTDVREDLTDRLFDEEQYVVHILENSVVPVALLNLTGSWNRLSEQGMHFVLAEAADVEDLVKLDSETGQIHLMKQLDRERNSEYRFKVRALAPLEVFRSSEERPRNNYHHINSLPVPTTSPASVTQKKRDPFVRMTSLADQLQQHRHRQGSSQPLSGNTQNKERQDRWRHGRISRSTRNYDALRLWMKRGLGSSTVSMDELTETIFDTFKRDGRLDEDTNQKEAQDIVYKPRRIIRSSEREWLGHSSREDEEGYNIPAGDVGFGTKLTRTADSADGVQGDDDISLTLLQNHQVGSSNRQPRILSSEPRTLDTPPSSTTSSSSLQLNEVWIVLKVLDENDNAPQFMNEGRSVVGAVLATEQYGHVILRIRVSDPDDGVHGMVRFTMLQSGPADQARHKFAVDSQTGRVSVVGGLRGSEGRMFGFDVRATDNAGASDGLSSVTNVLVHVLSPHGQVVVEVGAAPRAVEPYLKDIQRALSNASGVDVRVHRVVAHPHQEAEGTQGDSTDLYVYGVSRDTEAVMAGMRLREALGSASPGLRMPKGLKVVGLRIPQPHREGNILQTPELAILMGAAAVLLVTVVALMCVCHKQRKRRRKPRPSPFTSGSGVAVGGGGGGGGGRMSVLPLAFPGGPLPYTHMSDRSSAASSDEPTKSQIRSFEHHLSKFPHLHSVQSHLGEFHLRKNRSYIVGRKKSDRESRRLGRQSDLCGRIHSHTAECCQAFSSSGANSDEDGIPSRSPRNILRKSPYLGVRKNVLLEGSLSPNSDLMEVDLERAGFRRSRRAHPSKRGCCATAAGCPSHRCCTEGCSTTTTATTVVSPHSLHQHYRNHSPDSLERNSSSSSQPRHGHHHHHHHHHRNSITTPHHHSSLHSLTHLAHNNNNNSSNHNMHGSTPALPTYPYPYPGPAPPPVPPNKPKHAFVNSNAKIATDGDSGDGSQNIPVISIPRGQLRRPQMPEPHNVTEL